MTFKDIKRGDTFRVSLEYMDEWVRRGEWMRTDIKTEKGAVCVCLTQGNNSEGETKEWLDGIPVVMVKKRHLCSRSESLHEG